MKFPRAVIPSIKPPMETSKSSPRGTAMTALQKWLSIEFQTMALETPQKANKSDPNKIRARAPRAAAAASPKLRFGLKT